MGTSGVSGVGVHLQSQTLTPPYWQDACAYLCKADPVMAQLIAQIGSEVGLRSEGKAFVTLARSIVGQQISVKAAQSIWDRLAALTSIDPQAVLGTPPEALRAVGLSMRKVEYLHDLARHFAQGDLHKVDWASMDDAAVVKALTAVRGIGKWTAEMFMIFYLLRPNVLPLDDVGLLKGVGKLYLSAQAAQKDAVKRLAQNWQPYCSVATWYIWRSLDPLPVAY